MLENDIYKSIAIRLRKVYEPTSMFMDLFMNVLVKLSRSDMTLKRSMTWILRTEPFIGLLVIPYRTYVSKPKYATNTLKSNEFRGNHETEFANRSRRLKTK